MDGGVIGIIIGILAFLGGILLKDKLQRQSTARKVVESAQQTEMVGEQNATAEHLVRQKQLDIQKQASLARIKEDAEATVGKRPITGDAVVDLADRLRRHAARRRRERNSSS